jgi:hypothetical protein
MSQLTCCGTVSIDRVTRCLPSFERCVEVQRIIPRSVLLIKNVGSKLADLSHFSIPFGLDALHASGADAMDPYEFDAATAIFAQ